MIAYILAATLWISIEHDDGTTIKCEAKEPIKYRPAEMVVRAGRCEDKIFSDGFE